VKTTRTGRTTSSSVSSEPVVEGDMESRVSIALDHGLRAGDSFTLTSGREVYPMGNGGLLEVGPVQAMVHVRDGEKAHEVYSRARALVEVLMHADFEMKRVTYSGRLKELHGS